MTTPTSRTATRPASGADFDLVVPGDWWRVPLTDAAARSSAINALVRHQLPDRDSRSAATHQAQAMLADVAGDAARAGGRVMWFSTRDVGGMPLPISLVVAEHRRADEAFQRAVESSYGTDGLESGRMGPGMVVRSVAERVRDVTDLARHQLRQAAAAQGEPDGQGGRTADGETPAEPRTVRTLVADYYLRRPDDRLVHLSFATPLVQLREALVGLFDTVVDSVTWRDQAQPAQPTPATETTQTPQEDDDVRTADQGAHAAL